jgi:hypothetical protein
VLHLLGVVQDLTISPLCWNMSADMIILEEYPVIAEDLEPSFGKLRSGRSGDTLEALTIVNTYQSVIEDSV